jgi:GDPmannose 4,6-dehydratase
LLQLIRAISVPIDTLWGDPSKARDRLGWTPRTGFDELVADMKRADLAHATRDAMVTKSGYQVAQHHE